MSDVATKLNRARDVAANYRLIEEDELCVELDGRQHFERAVTEAIEEDEDMARDTLAKMKSFSTTSWKEDHPEAHEGRITWPWTLAR
jgi:very-short-patch-repair endonuclease